MFDSSGVLNVNSGLKFIIFDRTGPVPKGDGDGK